MSVIGRDVMERGAPPWGWEAPSAREVSESLSHTDMQAWTAASSHNRPEAVWSAAALSGEEQESRGRICCCLESAVHRFPTGCLLWSVALDPNCRSMHHPYCHFKVNCILRCFIAFTLKLNVLVLYNFRLCALPVCLVGDGHNSTQVWSNC